MSPTISSPNQEVENKVEPGSQRLDDPGRETFAQELVATGDLYSSYKTAGYKRPKGNANRMFREPAVQARVAWLYRKVEPLDQALAGWRRADLRRKLDAMVSVDRTEMYEEVVTDEGRRYLQVKPLDKLTDEQRLLFEGVGDGGRVVMPSKLAAAAQLAKLDGLDAPAKTALTDADGKNAGSLVVEIVRFAADKNPSTT